MISLEIRQTGQSKSQSSTSSPSLGAVEASGDERIGIDFQAARQGQGADPRDLGIGSHGQELAQPLDDRGLDSQRRQPVEPPIQPSPP